MSPYLLVGIIVAALAFVGSNQRYERMAYFVSFVLLTFFLAFRYGQGTDWLSYNYIFNLAPNTLDLCSSFYSASVHSEIGWKIINNLVKALGGDFVFLSVITSIVEMALLGKFLNRYSSNRAFSLLIGYPVVYLTYYFSMMRQGLVIAVFLGVMLDMLNERRFLPYILITAICTSIHSLSIVFIVPYFANCINRKSLSLMIAVCAAIGMALIPLLPRIIELLSMDYSTADISVLALMYRLGLALLVFFLFSSARRKGDNVDDLDHLIKVYVSGISIYLLFMGNDLYASRLASPMLAVELVLVPKLLSRSELTSRIPILVAVLLASSVMYVKNIDSYIDQAPYVQTVDVINYPYISIFNKQDIYLYSRNRYLPYL